METFKYKTSLIIYLLLFVSAIIFLPFLLSFLIRYVSYDYQASLDKTQRLDGLSTITQSFIARDKNLVAIGMSIKNPNFTNKTDLILQVYDKNKIKLGEAILKGANIADGDFVKFSFSPILLEVDEKYYFALVSPATPEQYPYGIYISDSSDQENHFINGIEDEGAISFVSFYKPHSRFALATDIYKKWFSKLVGDKPFFFVYLGGIISLLFSLVIKREFS